MADSTSDGRNANGLLPDAAANTDVALAPSRTMPCAGHNAVCNSSAHSAATVPWERNGLPMEILP